MNTRESFLKKFSVSVKSTATGTVVVLTVLALIVLGDRAHITIGSTCAASPEIRVTRLGNFLPIGQLLEAHEGCNSPKYWLLFGLLFV